MSLLLAIRWPHAACPSLGVGCPRLMYWQPLHCILLSFVCFSSFPIHFHTHSIRSQPPIQQGLIEPMGTPLFLLHLFYDCRAHSLSPHTPLSKGHVLHVLLYLTALHQADSALRTRQIRTWPCNGSPSAHADPLLHSDCPSRSAHCRPCLAQTSSDVADPHIQSLRHRLRDATARSPVARECVGLPHTVFVGERCG